MTSLPSHNFLELAGSIADIGGWELDLVSGTLCWSDQTCRLHDLKPGYRPTLSEALAYYDPEARLIIEAALRAGIDHGEPWDLELPLTSATGRRFWARAVGSIRLVDGKSVAVSGAFQDITKRRLLERELAENRQLLQVTLASITDAVITTGSNGRVRWMNPAAERLTGWTDREAHGRALARVFVTIEQFSRQPVDDLVAACLRLDQIVSPATGSILIARDGQEFGIEESARPVREAGERSFGAVLVFRDVTEQRRQDREREHRTTHDSLTGVANRIGLEIKLDALLAAAKTDPAASHVLLHINLDQFKVVNDACGHSVGDLLLRQISMLLKDSVRDGDLVARMGGDEFCVILEDCPRARGERIADRIRLLIDQHRFHHETRRFRVGASIGLVPFSGRWTSREMVLQAADVTCHAAKEAGRNQIQVWSESDRATNLRFGDMHWVARLEQALDDDQFELYGQRIEPLLETGRGIWCEVLLRMRDGDGGLVLPSAFVLAAERFHMATRIDRWVVRKVFQWMESNVTQQDALDMISINLSGQSIGDRSFHRSLCTMIRAARFDVRKLCLEITETAAVTRFEDAKAFIDEVRSLGVKVALDDFGAGASSFSYLKTLPVDFIKIDGQFINDILNDALDIVTVRCFRDVAMTIGVQTVAEFIEHEDQRQALVDLGIDYGQGYCLHRPESLSLAVSPIRRVGVSN